MRLSDFDYFLPKELIAQHPLKRRDGCRLMVVERKTEKIVHARFSDFLNYINPPDMLVLNDTKVIPARILGRKKSTFGRVDVLLSRKLNEKEYEVLVKPALRIGQEIIFNNGSVSAVFKEGRILEFRRPLSMKRLEKIGVMPLPPYIKRLPGKSDEKQYQTVYARKQGAIASPTAGLHFTKRILEKIKAKGAAVSCITLHVGTGTFKPVKCEDIREHKMDTEEYIVSGNVAGKLRGIKENAGKVFACGTTTARALEAVGKNVGRRTSNIYRGFTDIFIYPGYKFNVVDCLLTNFHLPKTTLFMLVSAFAGREFIMRAYDEAIKEKYRFYSYGDAMLII